MKTPKKIENKNNLKTTELLKTISQKGDEVTFEDIYRLIWLPKKQCSISSWAIEGRRIEKILLPHLGNIPIKDISPKIVIPCLAPYEDKLPTLQRLCMRVNEIMNFAMCADLIDKNRCSKMRIIYPHKKIEHLASIPASELPSFFHVLNTNEGRKPVKTWFKLFVLYHLYSMGRCNEVASLKWEYINHDVITIPAECMKGRRPHRIWLCPEMVEVFKILFLLQKDKRSEYVFNFTNAIDHHVHKQHFEKWLHHTSFAGILTPHGLRSTGRTWLRDIGCPTEVGEDFLAHVYGSATQRAYIRSDYLEQRKPYYQKWYDYLKQCWFMSQAFDPTYISNNSNNNANDIKQLL